MKDMEEGQSIQKCTTNKTHSDVMGSDESDSRDIRYK